MNLRSILVSCSILCLLSACVSSEEEKGESANVCFDYGADIDAMVAGMSIEEKVGQMTQINIDVISTGEIYNLVEPHTLDSVKLDSAVNHYFVGSILNVGGHTYSRDHWKEIITSIQTKATNEGNNIPILYGIDAIHGVNYTVGATLFPQQIGQAATWNPDLVGQGASVTAYECRASGIPWNFSPVLDIGRQPLWSRFFETYGEDVYLAKCMTEAVIDGYQGDDPSNPEKVASCMKHFLGYSTPLSGKDRTPAWIPERQLHEYYLPTFEKAIERNALTVMINSGEVNGIPVHANHDILTKLLRDELGFKGLAVTDWEDIMKLYKDHRIAKDMREAVKIAIEAGIDMSMTPNDYSFNHALIDLVKSGEVDESRLDLSCRRILWVKKQLGILESPMPNFEAYDKFASKEHKQSALTTAEESITLLKNIEDLLPLDKSANILVCGPAAHSLNIQNGAWTHTWQGVDTAYNTAGINTIYESLVKYSEGQVEYVLGSSLFEQVDIQKAVNAARKSNVIVVCLGEIPSTEKPGDIDDLNLPASQRELVKELSKLGKPMVFALVFNRPMIIREIEPLANAILQCYLPGDYGGEAFARILYGEVNPSGKLPFTYPRHTGTFVPYDHKYTETLDKNFGRNAFNPQWEFGFGLSYSQFEYSNLKLDSETFAKDGQIQVSFTVANASDSPGKEVVQVYVTDMVASISPSVKRLRAFDKIAIGARDSVEVSMSIPVNELSFVGKENLWVIQEGEFVLSVANNSVTFEVK
jgi:beta-glucosidase